MRDLTEQQFQDALRRHGMKPVGFMGYIGIGAADYPHRVFVCRYNAGNNRRRQLAWLLCEQQRAAQELADIQVAAGNVA